MIHSMMIAEPEPSFVSLTGSPASDRYSNPTPTTVSQAPATESDVTIDFIRGRLMRGGVATPLTYKELQLLRYLIAHPDTVVSRQDLLSNVWGYRSTTTRTVDVHMAGLRRKLEDDPRSPRYIQTVRGAGYKLCADLRSLQAEQASAARGNGA